MSILEFSKKLNVLVPNLMRELMRRQKGPLAKGEISLPQLLVLNYINNKGGAIMSEIARHMSATLSAATGMVDRLVQSGFLLRERDEKDRRIVKISLTNKGRDIVGRVEKERLLLIKETFGKLTEEERERYLEILEKVFSILGGRTHGATS